MKNIKHAAVREIFGKYPPSVREKLLFLRQLVFITAAENKCGEVEEALKWNEPSYLVKGGSTVRMNWKKSTPHQYALYFNCKTTLVETFKEIYGDIFSYEGNRAIIFSINDDVPVAAVKQCVVLALTYHKVKHLQLLGT